MDGNHSPEEPVNEAPAQPGQAETNPGPTWTQRILRGLRVPEELVVPGTKPTPASERGLSLSGVDQAAAVEQKLAEVTTGKRGGDYDATKRYDYVIPEGMDTQLAAEVVERMRPRILGLPKEEQIAMIERALEASNRPRK